MCYHGYFCHCCFHWSILLKVEFWNPWNKCNIKSERSVIQQYITKEYWMVRPKRQRNWNLDLCYGKWHINYQWSKYRSNGSLVWRNDVNFYGSSNWILLLLVNGLDNVGNCSIFDVEQFIIKKVSYRFCKGNRWTDKRSWFTL